jgi:hypothetical protein
MSLEKSNGQSKEPVIPPSALAFLRRLEDFQDPRVGLPITSHRKPPFGTILVLAKKGFRSLFQLFINETMRKQFFFNDALVKLVHVIYRDINSLEGATLAARAGILERLRNLEERLAGLEAEAKGANLGSSDIGPTIPIAGDNKN